MEQLTLSKFPSIERYSFETLQVNIGYKCNQTCIHCHVNAGPHRWEMMDEYNLFLIPEVLKKYNVETLDITGGAPELHPLFKDLIIKARSLNVEVIDRCNLTILEEPGFEGMANFLAKNKVQITASLPCYLEANVDNQRGEGVFDKSIRSLKKLNHFGYGMPNSNLILNLVYNPIGAYLPPSQKELETSYRKELYQKFGIHFSSLLALANMPINRFANQLKISGELESYQTLLRNKHNPTNLKSVMCRKSISVDWQGNLYDCDFNQQIGLRNLDGLKKLEDLARKKTNIKGNIISVGDHCFGCTAGCGSSCGGALEKEI